MNGHFAAVGDEPTREQYGHGVQVIDEDKEFKFVAFLRHPPYPIPYGILTMARLALLPVLTVWPSAAPKLVNT